MPRLPPGSCKASRPKIVRKTRPGTALLRLLVVFTARQRTTRICRRPPVIAILAAMMIRSAAAFTRLPGAPPRKKKKKTRRTWTSGPRFARSRYASIGSGWRTTIPTRRTCGSMALLWPIVIHPTGISSSIALWQHHQWLAHQRIVVPSMRVVSHPANASERTRKGALPIPFPEKAAPSSVSRRRHHLPRAVLQRR